MITGAISATGIAAMVTRLATSGMKPDEDKVNTTYFDRANIPTYCHGHADRSSKVGTPHTDAQCDAILFVDVKVEQAGVAACVPGLRNQPYQ